MARRKMTAKEKKEVSKRMKVYWAHKRAGIPTGFLEDKPKSDKELTRVIREARGERIARKYPPVKKAKKSLTRKLTLGNDHRPLHEILKSKPVKAKKEKTAIRKLYENILRCIERIDTKSGDMWKIQAEVNSQHSKDIAELRGEIKKEDSFILTCTYCGYRYKPGELHSCKQTANPSTVLLEAYDNPCKSFPKNETDWYFILLMFILGLSIGFVIASLFI